MERCVECYSEMMMIDYQRGDLVCKECGLVKQGVICMEYDEMEKVYEVDELVSQMVGMYGFEEGMDVVMTMKYKEYKRKSGKRRIYKKEYVICALLMNQMGKMCYEYMSGLYCVDVKELKEVHVKVSDVLLKNEECK